MGRMATTREHRIGDRPIDQVRLVELCERLGVAELFDRPVDLAAKRSLRCLLHGIPNRLKPWTDDTLVGDRATLDQVLRGPGRRTLAEALTEIPRVGTDEGFARTRALRGWWLTTTVIVFPIDTDVVSELRKRERASRAVLRFFAQFTPESDRCFAVAYADEPPHPVNNRHESRGSGWLWALASEEASYFTAGGRGRKIAARGLLGDSGGVLVTDGYACSADVPPDRRQLCWAHELRPYMIWRNVACASQSRCEGRVQALVLSTLTAHVRYRSEPFSGTSRLKRHRRSRMPRRVASFGLVAVASFAAYATYQVLWISRGLGHPLPRRFPPIRSSARGRADEGFAPIQRARSRLRRLSGAVRLDVPQQQDITIDTIDVVLVRKNERSGTKVATDHVETDANAPVSTAAGRRRVEILHALLLEQRERYRAVADRDFRCRGFARNRHLLSRRQAAVRTDPDTPTRARRVFEGGDRDRQVSSGDLEQGGIEFTLAVGDATAQPASFQAAATRVRRIVVTSAVAAGGECETERASERGVRETSVHRRFSVTGRQCPVRYNGHGSAERPPSDTDRESCESLGRDRGCGSAAREPMQPMERLRRVRLIPLVDVHGRPSGERVALESVGVERRAAVCRGSS